MSISENTYLKYTHFAGIQNKKKECDKKENKQKRNVMKKRKKRKEKGQKKLREKKNGYLRR